MDNIQRLVAGVLGVSGMIAMLVPSGDILSSKSPAISQETPLLPDSPLPPGNTEIVSDEEELLEEDSDSDDLDEDVFAMGEPAIDGNPLGTPASIPEYNTSSSASPTGPTDYGQQIAPVSGQFDNNAVQQPIAPPGY